MDVFAPALEPEEDRRHGRSGPRDCRQPLMLQYRRLGQFSGWLGRVLELFPPEQVQIFPPDDLKGSPRSTCEAVLGSLGVRPDGRQEFPKANPGEVQRLAGLQLLPS